MSGTRFLQFFPILALAMLAGTAHGAEPAQGTEVDCTPSEQYAGQSIPVILFPVDSDRLSPKDMETLRTIARRARYAFSVCVIGQSDKQGRSAYNNALALRRARAVADALIGFGVSPRVVTVRGVGEPFGGLTFGGADKERQDRRVSVVFVR
ncbi:MAG: OmpA family protein [Alphaproteobacteria bacterium]